MSIISISVETKLTQYRDPLPPQPLKGEQTFGLTGLQTTWVVGLFVLNSRSFYFIKIGFHGAGQHTWTIKATWDRDKRGKSFQREDYLTATRGRKRLQKEER